MAGELGAPGLEAGFRLGSSVALGPELGVAGSPGAVGGQGRAAVFSRAGEARWSEAVWLEPGGDLETIVGEEVTCAEGQAAQFACEDVDLVAFLSIDALGGGPGERVSDLWGWTDPETSRSTRTTSSSRETAPGTTASSSST